CARTDLVGRTGWQLLAGGHRLSAREYPTDEVRGSLLRLRPPILRAGGGGRLPRFGPLLSRFGLHRALPPLPDDSAPRQLQSRPQSKVRRTRYVSAFLVTSSCVLRA